MDIVAVKDSELERYVTKIMLEIGVPAHLKGYHYLRDAIILSGKDMEVVSSVTSVSYDRKTFQDHRPESGTRHPECH